MRGVFSEFIGACLEIWKSIGVPQKVSILLFICATFLAISMVLYFGSRPNMVVLYSNMDSDSASKVMQIVESEGIKFETRDMGMTVLVPQKSANRVRAKVTSAKIKFKDGVDMDVIGKVGITRNQFQYYKRLLKQDEIRKMIMDLPAVATARVELSMPSSKSVFQRKKNEEASATIFLELNGEIFPQQIDSIRYMVSSAASIPIDHVTVVDDKGRLLARHKNGDEMANSDSHYAMRAKYEMEFESKIRAVLEPVVGMKVVPKVTVDLEYEQIEKVEEKYAEKGIKISETSTVEENIKEQGKNSGVAGTGSNVTVSVKDQSTVNTNNEKSSQNTKRISAEYVVPKTVIQSKLSGTKIKSISVAVTIPQIGETPRSAEDLEKLKKLVMSAVGAVSSVERTDTIEILEETFIVEEVVTASIPFTDTLIYNIEKFSSLSFFRFIGGLLILLIVFKVFKKQMSTEVTRVDFENEVMAETLRTSSRGSGSE